MQNIADKQSLTLYRQAPDALACPDLAMANRYPWAGRVLRVSCQSGKPGI